MIKWGLGIWIIASLISCSESSSYEGFSVSKTGLNYKIETLGEPYLTVNDSDYITFSITKYSDKGKVLSQTKIIQDTIYQSQLDTGLFEFIGLLNLGDSGSFVQDDAGKVVLKSIKLIEASSSEQIKVRQLLSVLPDSITLMEKEALANWLNGYEKDSIEIIEGVYKVKLISGYGGRPKKGNEVVFHMESFLPNKHMVESTKSVNKPFSYFMGDLDQVIDGVGIAINSMQKEEKSIFIIPSHLAYGARGSSTKIVSANQPILYQIELLNVIRVGVTEDQIN